MTKSSLSHRAATALRETISSADATAILADVNAAIIQRSADLAKIRETSLDPLITDLEAQRLRQSAADIGFEVERLARLERAVTERVNALRSEERRAADKAETADAISERDQLAAVIADRYPQIVGEMTDLVRRIEASDSRLKACGEHGSGEALGRGVPGNFYGIGPILRLRDSKLPMPDGTAAWSLSMITGVKWPGLSLLKPVEERGPV
jgi:hypothetical protein